MRNMSIEEVARFLVKFSSILINEEVDKELVEECIMFLNADYEIQNIDIEIDEDEELSCITDNSSNLDDIHLYHKEK